MKKVIFKAITLTFVVALLMAVALVDANAASAKLSFSDPTVTVGNKVTISAYIKGDDIAGYQMNISYDTSYLEYVGASGSSGNFSVTYSAGVLKVVDYLGSGSTGQMSFSMTFKALKTGSTVLEPSGCRFSSGSADTITPSAVGNSTVTIKPVPEASSDCNLKNLSISGGSLYPDFNANTTSYSADVDFSVETLAVSAIKNHSGASVYVSNTSLAVGENTVSVTVTAENGAKKTYTIKVTRGKNPLSTDIFVTLEEGKTAEVAAAVPAESIPKGFSLTIIKLGEVEVEAVIYDEKGLPAVYVIGNENVEAGYYFLNVGDMTIKRFDYVGGATSSLTLLDITLVEAPEGYTIGKFMVGETEKDVLVPTNVETANHCLVYAIGLSGTKMLYMYDPIENTYQRYDFAELGEPETTVPEQTEAPEKEAEETKSEQKNEQKKEKNWLFSNPVFLWTFIIIAALIVILIVVGLVIAIRSRV